MSTETEVDPAVVETEATSLGWRPKERFRGDPEHWVDAATYLKRGKEVLPLVKAENSRLAGEVGSLKSQLAAASAALAETKDSIKGLTEFQAEMLAAKLKEQKRDIRARLRQAREDNDESAITSLEEELDEVDDAQREVKEKKPTAKKETPPQTETPPPEFLSWKADNPWFGGDSKEDRRKTGIAMALANEAAADGKRGQAIFDYIDAEMPDLFGKRPPPNKAEGSGRPAGGGGRGSDGQSYADLPSEAKAQCDKDAKRFVGANKGFKDEAAWRAHFAKLYFTE